MPPTSIPIAERSDDGGSRRAHPQFGSWAALYKRFRPGYPQAVFDLLAALTKGQADLCVDLGAGSGQATMDLLQRFAAVEAVEPDPDMVALIPAAPGLSAVVETAEAYAGPPALADAVVAASALHWMDQSAIVAKAATWLRPGGVFFAFSYGAVQYPSATVALQRALQSHARRSRVHVHAKLSDFEPYALAIEASGAYRAHDTFELYVDHRWSPTELAGFLMSTSYGQATAASTGDANGYFEALAADIEDAGGDRAVLVRLPVAGAFGITAA